MSDDHLLSSSPEYFGFEDLVPPVGGAVDPTLSPSVEGDRISLSQEVDGNGSESHGVNVISISPDDDDDTISKKILRYICKQEILDGTDEFSFGTFTKKKEKPNSEKPNGYFKLELNGWFHHDGPRPDFISENQYHARFAILAWWKRPRGNEAAYHVVTYSEWPFDSEESSIVVKGSQRGYSVTGSMLKFILHRRVCEGEEIEEVGVDINKNLKLCMFWKRRNGTIACSNTTHWKEGQKAPTGPLVELRDRDYAHPPSDVGSSSATIYFSSFGVSDFEELSKPDETTPILYRAEPPELICDGEAGFVAHFTKEPYFFNFVAFLETSDRNIGFQRLIPNGHPFRAGENWQCTYIYSKPVEIEFEAPLYWKKSSDQWIRSQKDCGDEPVKIFIRKPRSASSTSESSDYTSSPTGHGGEGGGHSSDPRGGGDLSRKRGGDDSSGSTRSQKVRRTNGGNTMTHYMAYRNAVDEAKEYPALGLECFAYNDEGYAPIHVAFLMEHREISDVLLKSIKEEYDKHDGPPRLDQSHSPTTEGESEGMEGLHGKMEEELFNACNDGDIKRVRALLALGVDANIRNDEGLTPLDVAVQANSVKCVEILKKWNANRFEEKGEPMKGSRSSSHETELAFRPSIEKVHGLSESDPKSRIPVDPKEIELKRGDLRKNSNTFRTTKKKNRSPLIFSPVYLLGDSDHQTEDELLDSLLGSENMGGTKSDATGSEKDSGKDVDDEIEVEFWDGSAVLLRASRKGRVKSVVEVETWRSEVDGRIERVKEKGGNVLNLSRKGLKEVPGEIFSLSRLEVLDLSWNELTSIPVEIGALTNLRVLYLDNNQLTRVPDELWTLTNLTYLNLGGNQLKSVPADIGALSNLKELNLWDNQLTRVPDELWTLTNLTYLNLGGNQLKSVPAEIGALSNLKKLNLWDNQLTRVPDELWTLTNLTLLNLGGNQLKSIPPKIGALSNLEFLQLNGNKKLSHPPYSIIDEDSSTNTATRVKRYCHFPLQVVFAHGTSEELKSHIEESTPAMINVQDEYGRTVLHYAAAQPGEPFSWFAPFRSRSAGVVSTVTLLLEKGARTNIKDKDGKTPRELAKSSQVAKVLQQWELKSIGGRATKRIRSKIVIAGEGKAGKSTLVRHLIKAFSKMMRGEGDIVITSINPDESTFDRERTIGIDTFVVKGEYKGTPFQWTIWDLAGQNQYLGSHQLFFTQAMFVVVFRVDQLVGEDRVPLQKQISQWLRSIHQRVYSDDNDDGSRKSAASLVASSSTRSKPPLLLVGTHVDKYLKDRSKVSMNVEVHKVSLKYKRWKAFDLNKKIMTLGNIGDDEEERATYDDGDVSLVLNTLFDHSEVMEVPNSLINLEMELMKRKKRGKRMITMEDMKEIARDFEDESSKLVENIDGAIWIMEGWGSLILIGSIIVIDVDWFGKLVACAIDSTNRPIRFGRAIHDGILRKNKVKTLLGGRGEKDYYSTLPSEAITGKDESAFYLDVLIDQGYAFAMDDERTKVLIPLALPKSDGEEDCSAVKKGLETHWNAIHFEHQYGLRIFFTSNILRRGRKNDEKGKKAVVDDDVEERELGIPISLFPMLMVELLKNHGVRCSLFHWRHGLIFNNGSDYCLLKEDRTVGSLIIVVQSKKQDRGSAVLIRMMDETLRLTRMISVGGAVHPHTHVMFNRGDAISRSPERCAVWALKRSDRFDGCVEDISTYPITFGHGSSLTEMVEEKIAVVDHDGVELSIYDLGVSSLLPNTSGRADPSTEVGAGSERSANWKNKLHIDKVHEKGYKGNDIRIAILDSGIDTSHPQLPKAPSLIYEDFTDTGKKDENGHGTHVAGIIAGKALGIAPECTLLIGKVSGGDETKSVDHLEKGIQWAVEQRADVINLSLGFEDHISSVEKALNKAKEAGCVIVVAAGNDGAKTANYILYPAKYGNYIAVGSHNYHYKESGLTAVGKELDFLAPGENILSTYSKDAPNIYKGKERMVRGSDAYTDVYMFMSGNSMAAAFASGIVALCLQHQRKNKSKDDPEKIKRMMPEKIKRMMIDHMCLRPQGYLVVKPWGKMKVWPKIN